MTTSAEKMALGKHAFLVFVRDYDFYSSVPRSIRCCIYRSQRASAGTAAKAPVSESFRDADLFLMCALIMMMIKTLIIK